MRVNKTICIVFLLPSLLFAGDNALKAGLSSLILPGLGERYLGLKTRAYGFLTTEVSLWLTYAGFSYHARRLDEDWRTFAYTHCGADPTREDEDYWKALEMNMSREDYLEDLWREARQYYPDNPDSQAIYVQKNAISGDWCWPSRKVWFRFQDIRKAARKAYIRAEIVLGCILANHIASAIDAFISAKLLGDNSAMIDIDMSINPRGRSSFVVLKRF